MKRRSFLSLFGLAAIPQTALALPARQPALLGGGDPAEGYGWEIITLQGEFGNFDSRGLSRIHFHRTIAEDLWARKLTWSIEPSTPGTSLPYVDFVMEVRGDALYRIAPTPAPVQMAEDAFYCIAPEGILLRPGSQITGYFEAPAEGATVWLQLHCVRLAKR